MNTICVIDVVACPMGIVDYGITASGASTSYDTTSFLANASIYSLSVENSALGSDEYYLTFQLNVVLEFENSGTWYVYWVQDCALVDTATHSIAAYIDNIWNNTAPGSEMHSTSVSGNGYVDTSSTPNWYLDEDTSPTGTIHYPGTFQVMVNSSTGAGPQPTVQFMYDDGQGFVTYDLVTFTFVKDLQTDLGFVVNYAKLDPVSDFYDAEWILGGPGGGSTTTDEGSSVALQLQWWNGANFETVNNALNYGGDTAESILAVSTGSYYTGSGLLFANVTAGTETWGELWYLTQIAIAEVEGPGNCDGVVRAGVTAPLYTPYLDGHAWIAVHPVPIVGGLGDTFFVECTGYTEDLGHELLTTGGTTVITVSWPYIEFEGFPVLSRGGPATWGVRIGTYTQTSYSSSLMFWRPSDSGIFDWWAVVYIDYLATPSSGSFSVATADQEISISWSPVGISASRSGVDVGQAVQFSVTNSVPTGTTYSWVRGLPPGCASANAAEITCSPTTAGTYSFGVTLTEPDGFTVTSALFTFVVDSDPSVSTPVATPASIDLGQTADLSTTASGGTGTYTYSWAGLPAGCSSTSSPTLACTPTATGTFSIQVSVTDSHGYVVTSGSASLTVLSDPTQSPPTPSPSTGEVGESLTFTAKVADGSGGGTYAWSAPPGLGCTASTGPTLNCVLASTGMFTVSYSWTDSNGVAATGNTALQFFVEPGPSATTPSTFARAVDVGQNVTFTTTISSPGSGGDTYSWSVTPSTGLGCSSSDQLSVGCLPTTPGTYTVTFTVTDSNGISAHSDVTFTVYSDVAVSSFGASPTSVTKGTVVALAAVVTGGLAPYTYSYGGLPTGCTSSNSSSLSCTSTEAGTFTVTLTVTDANGFHTAATTSFTVSAPSPSVLGVSGLVIGAVIAVVVIAIVAGALLVLRGRRRRAAGTPATPPTPPTPPPPETM